ncbi:hypothetical protein BO83DRAFT_377156 [Aspergillus eucalypticola CBS 122712]|uniref:Uncharacterized protein n=1 Tax=Aspergillus eucalypticola (strain CBS 122712 / IBT 29274) TaxID=1448314 RepID=A0A317VUI8_ASPEC|nr:uncharacterized protein BO83DRAFT_377156 [Aspergillus eucalypticola CBS 122712]PWY76687.1 hypothetical protein BO83DRAFT_377156 [Aspergillus eucalypticola CBS 122712]
MIHSSPRYAQGGPDSTLYHPFPTLDPEAIKYASRSSGNKTWNTVEHGIIIENGFMPASDNFPF